MKKVVLSKKYKRLPLLFAMLFAATGAYFVFGSHAATPSTTVYGYYDASAIYVNNAAPKLLDDYLSQASGQNTSKTGAYASYSSVKVVEVKAGDVVTVGGKGGGCGGVCTTMPKFISNTTCYIVRPTTAKGASLSIASSYTTSTVRLRAPGTEPVSSYSSYWSRQCVKNTATTGTYPTYSIKVLSGDPVRIVSIEYLNELAY
jgi:hypothetical protein